MSHTHTYIHTYMNTYIHTYKYTQLAKEQGLWLSLGGFHELCEDEVGKVYNTHAILDSDGQLVCMYVCMCVYV